MATLAGIDLGGISVDERDGTSVVRRDGRLVVALAVVDGALVASNDPRADLEAAGRVPAAPPAPPAGALRARIEAETLQEPARGPPRAPGVRASRPRAARRAVLTGRAERDGLDLELVLPIAGGA